ncbi:phosphoribosylformylglycinamidine synthase [Fulvivirgaceae bacterium LMO-SS25]
MILFFEASNNRIFAISSKQAFEPNDIEKLSWLLGNAKPLNDPKLAGTFIGPRKEMVTPWSTNAVEITQNMGLQGIIRMEEFSKAEEGSAFDPMLQHKYAGLDQTIFTIEKQPDSVLFIDDIAAYNEQEGLALNPEEIDYLNDVSKQLDRKLTDSEVFGFSQVNSEHCRHKIFNGTFIIDGEEKPSTLFQLIKKTSKENPNRIVSAYKDNVAFVDGPQAMQFAPDTQDKADYFSSRPIQTVLSLKAETHNFPTTVEPFNGAATGSGGEIRDRMAGGRGSLPLAGTAVYMTSYPRLEKGRSHEDAVPERNWLYQTPLDILIKASNGASDFGNKFGQPLICGSVLTFENEHDNIIEGFDKVIMLAGGLGFGVKDQSLKDVPSKGDLIIVMGGDNYRIGMGGGAVSSVATGEFSKSIELNAIQRSNPEMQKRVYNAIRALAEMPVNPIVSIHDHGAGGHLNCLSELVEHSGGTINLRKLPVGDPTLSAKEIIGNESQERMGLVIKKKDLHLLEKIAERERAPLYIVGEIHDDHYFRVLDPEGEYSPIDLELAHFFGSSPVTILEDTTAPNLQQALDYDAKSPEKYIKQVLQIEAVACKDWLTNKVDRSVTGRVAAQQTVGSLQLPLNDYGIMALDYEGKVGEVTSIGHAPVAALVNPAAGSRLAIAEALTNMVGAPIADGLKGVSLSANWMWPAKNPGENTRLYAAVEAISEFSTQLGLNVPTGKDSLSMSQKYPDGRKVLSPGTVIISSIAEVPDISKAVGPVLRDEMDEPVFWIDFSNSELALGGSSFAQTLSKVGEQTPDISSAAYFAKAFHATQALIRDEYITAAHDISAGGLLTTLLEMCFAQDTVGLAIDLEGHGESDLCKLLYAENPGVVVQVRNEKEVSKILSQFGVKHHFLGYPNSSKELIIKTDEKTIHLNIAEMREDWFKTSYLFEKHQTKPSLAKQRFENFQKQGLSFQFPSDFEGKLASHSLTHRRTGRSGIKAAIIREKGVNGDREMAYSLHLAGFDVKDVHMTDLISGREDLSDVNMIAFVGGFSNSDVLGSAKGWAGAFLYNEKAKAALDAFYQREDTLSLGVCNGCQLMVELDLVCPDHSKKPKMLHNASGKFESAFLTVEVTQSKSIMLNALAGSRLGIWVAHGEGQFHLPMTEDDYAIAAKYAYQAYPGNPNGSDYNVAALCSVDGRHLAIMPHLERSIFPWQWAHYPAQRNEDQMSPWLLAFVEARKWVETKMS